MTPPLPTPVPTAIPPAAAAALRLTCMHGFDPASMTLALQDGALEHVQLGRGVFRGDIVHTHTPGSRLDWGRYGLSVLARGDLSRDRVTVMLGLAGQGDWRGHGQQVASGDIVVFPEGGDLLVTVPPQARWLSLQVPRQRLERAGLALAGCLQGSARRLPGTLGGELLHTLQRLAPTLAPGAVAALAPQQVELAHDELLAALLGEVARRGGSVDGGHAMDTTERWRLVRRAEAYLDAQADPLVRIDDLCVAAGSSLSRLERAFRDAYGTGPRRFTTLRRLAGARQELLRGDSGGSVTDTAMRWGFWHLGRFAQAYRAHYGEAPSHTLQAVRRGGGRPVS